MTIEAEQAFLGCVLFENAELTGCSLRPEHMELDLHGRVLAHMLELHERGSPADSVTVHARLAADEDYVDMGGVSYLLELVDKAPPSSNTKAYSEVVLSSWARREIGRVSKEAQQGVAEGRPTGEVISTVRTQLDALEVSAAGGDEGVSAVEAASEVVDQIDHEIRSGVVKGYKCGLSFVDRRMGALQPGSLIIGAGRPSMGKTAVACAVFHGAARSNPKSLFAIFSIEMTRRQLTERMLSRLSAEDDWPIPYDRIGKNDLTPMERQRLHELKRQAPQNLRIFDNASLSVDDVRRRVWALKRRGPLAAILIDYLQIMRRPAAAGRNETTVIGEMTMALKNLAKEANIAVLLLSQLSRAVDGREDKRPQLSDLRESGSIEQDADTVFFPFREVYYLQRSEPRENSPKHAEWEMEVQNLRRRLDVIIAKNRHGPVCVEQQEFDAEFDSVKNWSSR